MHGFAKLGHYVSLAKNSVPNIQITASVFLGGTDRRFHRLKWKAADHIICR